MLSRAISKLSGCKMTSQLAVTTGDFSGIVAMATAGIDAAHTRRAYTRHLNSFVAYAAQYGNGFNRLTVQNYKQAMIAAGASAANVNQALSAIRKLADEASYAGLIDDSTRRAIVEVKGVKVQGEKLGRWLTAQEAQAMVNAPDTSTVMGLRDRAILAVMIGAGLRREEVTRLTLAHFQQVMGRWVIVDLSGKHGRTRSIGIASWVKFAIDAYTLAAAIADDTPIFRAARRGDHLQDRPMTDQAVQDVVKRYAPAGVNPHDLRRTYAKLARQAGAPLEQIQLSLGHASLATTERYLGSRLDLAVTPSDLIAVKLDA